MGKKKARRIHFFRNNFVGLGVLWEWDWYYKLELCFAFPFVSIAIGIGKELD